MKILKIILNKVEFIASIFNNIAAIALFLLFLIMNYDLFARFLFNSPMKGAAEIGTYLIVALAFFGLGHSFNTGRQVKIELVTMYLPNKLVKVLDIFFSVIAAAFFLLMTWKIASVAHNDFVRKILFPRSSVPLPIWWISFLASLGTAMLVVSLMLHVVRQIIGLGSSAEKNS